MGEVGQLLLFLTGPVAKSRYYSYLATDGRRSLAYLIKDVVVQPVTPRQWGAALCSVCLLSLSALPALATSPRELYQQAADALAAGQIAQASGLLETLVTEHGESELAEVARYHWAECLYLQAEPGRALEILQHWEHSSTSASSGQHRERCQALTQRILLSLPHEPASLRLLEKQWAGKTPPQDLKGVVERAIARELAERYQRSHCFAQAQEWWQALLADSQGELRQLYQHRLHVELPLAWAAYALQQSDPRQAVSVLQTALASEHVGQHWVDLRFVLAEAWLAAGQESRAAAEYEELAAWAVRQAAPPPVWLASVRLRQAELLVRARRITAARELLQQAKSEHADFALAYEYDYLLARCAMAEIEFDQAEQLLSGVVAAAGGTQAEARAGWLLGEVQFLQQRYLLAVAAYGRVAELTAFPHWQARALLQSAKCHELLGDPARALADYQRATELNPGDEIVQPASERMAVIEAAQATFR